MDIQARTVLDTRDYSKRENGDESRLVVAESDSCLSPLNDDRHEADFESYRLKTCRAVNGEGQQQQQHQQQQNQQQPRRRRRRQREEQNIQRAPEQVKNEQLQDKAKQEQLQDEIQNEQLQEKVQHEQLQDEIQHEQLQEKVQHEQLQEKVQHEQLQEEVQHEQLREEVQHEQLQEELQHEQLQEEVKHEQLRREQKEVHNGHASDDDEDYEQQPRRRRQREEQHIQRAPEQVINEQLQDKAQHEQSKDEIQNEQLHEEVKHEPINEEVQHVQLQEEVQHEQLQREQKEVHNEHASDDDEDYELQQQRLQRRQQLFELQQQLQILRELQQQHQQARPVDASDASDEESDDEREDGEREVTTPTAAHQTTTIATDGDSHVDGRGGDAADTHVADEQNLDIMKGEKQLERCASGEILKENDDEVDTGLPLLLRINEALNEAAGILSQSMGDCAVVDDLESGIKQELSIISRRRNGGHPNGDTVVESTPTDDLIRNDDVSGALSDTTRSPHNECDRRIIELPMAGDSRDGRDKRPRRICEATPTPQQCQAEAAVEIETRAQRRTRCNEDGSVIGGEEAAGRKPLAPDEELSVECSGHHARRVDGAPTQIQPPTVSITNIMFHSTPYV